MADNNSGFTDLDMEMAMQRDASTDKHAWQYGMDSITEFFGPDAPFWNDDLIFNELQPTTTYGGERTCNGKNTGPGMQPGSNDNVSITQISQIGHADGYAGVGGGSGNIQTGSHMQPNNESTEEQFNPPQRIFYNAYVEPPSLLSPISTNDTRLFDVLTPDFHNLEPSPHGRQVYQRIRLPHQAAFTTLHGASNDDNAVLGHVNVTNFDRANDNNGNKITGPQYPTVLAAPPGISFQGGINTNVTLPGATIRGPVVPYDSPMARAYRNRQFNHNHGVPSTAEPQSPGQYPYPRDCHSTPVTVSRMPSSLVGDQQFPWSTPYYRGRHTQSTEGAVSLRREMQQQPSFQDVRPKAIPFPDLSAYASAYATAGVEEAIEPDNTAAREPRKRKHSNGLDGIATPYEARPIGTNTSPIRKRRLGKPNQPYTSQTQDTMDNANDEEDATLQPAESGTMRVATHVQIPKPLPGSTTDSYNGFHGLASTFQDGDNTGVPSTGTSDRTPVKDRKKRAAQKHKTSLLDSGSAVSQIISDATPVVSPTTRATSEAATDPQTPTRRKRISYGISKFESKSLINQEDVLNNEESKKIGRRTLRSTVVLDDLLAAGPNAGQAARKRHAKKDDSSN